METRPLALTMGEPGGIGGEIAIAAWRRAREKGGPAFFAIDDPDRLRALGAPVAEIAAPAEAAPRFAEALPVSPLPLKAPAPAGRATLANAPVVVESIRRGVALVQSGAARALVTNPIEKRALYEGAGFAFPGHTEFLAELTGAPRAVMMLAGPQLRVVPVTIHIALAEVPKALTAEGLETTIRAAHAALISDFGCDRPRIAVAGLNPHAGEGGAMGREEIEIIAPTLERLRAEGMALDGPRSADTLFHAAARARYDAAVCMYHDQALIPIKTLDFDRGVNVTLGLPIVRTSPDHGVAFDIAGQGAADPTSLLAALEMADDIARRRGGA